MAEGNGLLNRRTGNACTGGSNPPLSVIIRTLTIRVDVLFYLKVQCIYQGDSNHR